MLVRTTTLALTMLLLAAPAAALAAPTATFTNGTLTVTGEAAAETLTIIQAGTHVRVQGPPGMNDPDGSGVSCAAFESGTLASCVDADVDRVVVDGGPGRDTLEEKRVSTADTDTLNGGAGDDKLTAPVSSSGCTCPLTLSGGEGDD